jgi:hypothetical protein
MAAALEECSTREVLDRNEAIEALKKEVEVFVAEKTCLTMEVGGLSSARVEVENLRKETDLLKKQVKDAKGAKALATKRAVKANETVDNLWKELNAEKVLGLALQQQVALLTECLEATKGLGLATVKMYVAALGQFGGSTSDMPEEPTDFSLLSWLKAHVEKLPAFVGGAADFGALAGATNYVKMLARGACTHTEIIKKEKVSGPSDLGATSPTLRRSIRNFMSSFWVDSAGRRPRRWRRTGEQRFVLYLARDLILFCGFALFY